MEYSKGELVCSDDKSRLDVTTIHGWIASSYWGRNIPRDVFERAINGSDCFGVYHGERQVAFARVVTDRATFAYLCDVIVDESVRGDGVGSWLMECIHAHEAYQGLRRWMLATRDAHGLYARFGWEPLPDARLFMQKHDPDVYLRAAKD